MLDESVSVYIVLRTPRQPEVKLESYVSRLAVNLEVQAHGFQPKTTDGQDVIRDSSPVRNEDALWSGSIDMSEKPAIIYPRENDRQSLRQMLAIWKMVIPLSGSLISSAFQGFR